MNIDERREIAFRMMARANGSLSFVEDYLERHPESDFAFLRSLYLLLSYSFELILKSRAVALLDVVSRKELDCSLKMLGHDVKKVALALGVMEMKGLGIEFVERKKEGCLDLECPRRTHDYYRIKLDGDEIRLEDFDDVRYDFMCKRTRLINGDEHKKILENINSIYGIYQKVKMANNGT